MVAGHLVNKLNVVGGSFQYPISNQHTQCNVFVHQNFLLSHNRIESRSKVCFCFGLLACLFLFFISLFWFFLQEKNVSDFLFREKEKETIVVVLLLYFFFVVVQKITLMFTKELF